MVVIRDYTGQGQEKREERVNATVCAVLEGFPSLTMRGWVIQRSLSSVPPTDPSPLSRTLVSLFRLYRTWRRMWDGPLKFLSADRRCIANEAPNCELRLALNGLEIRQSGLTSN